MAILNLSKYPDVCRLCLHPNNQENEAYFMVHSSKGEDDANILNKRLNEMFIPVPEVNARINRKKNLKK